MKNPNTVLLLTVIVAVLLMGVAFAAVQNITLRVSGTATAAPDQANFSGGFRFDQPEGKITYTGTGKAELRYLGYNGC